MATRNEDNITQANLLLDKINNIRVKVRKLKDKKYKNEHGQFFTDTLLARMMANFISQDLNVINLLDPGAGIGSLTSALVEKICSLEVVPEELNVDLFELDSSLLPFLNESMEICNEHCLQRGIRFTYRILEEDFIKSAVHLVESNTVLYNLVIMNPPYKKIKIKSANYEDLRSIRINTSNLYTAFFSLAIRLLEDQGEIVAITPRSFCNGPYFLSFRHDIISKIVFKEIHVFNSRSEAFSDDAVLQENIIFHCKKGKPSSSEKVVISSSNDPSDINITSNTINYYDFIKPDDPNVFFRIVKDNNDLLSSEKMSMLTHSLEEIGISVSTGKVVDFRVDEFIQDLPEEGSIPLIYPCHLINSKINWPIIPPLKPNALVISEKTKRLRVPTGNYVIIKRFTTKEERKRIVAALCTAELHKDGFGFENHLNYYHIDGKGLPINIAKGLVVYLNSSLVDSYFRQISGHTQVNVTDLKELKYPSLNELEILGSFFEDTIYYQEEIDRIVDYHV